MRRTLIGICLGVLIAPAALAQTGKHVAIGGAIGASRYVVEDFSSKNPRYTLAYRIRSNPEAQSGWKWAPKSSFNWYRRGTTSEIGGERTQLGRLQTVLVLGGIQRVMRQGPWQVAASVAGGPALHDFDVAGEARDAYQSRLGTELNGIKVKNSIAVRPEISAWYDVSDKLGLHGSLSYLFNRPKAETTSGGVTTTSTWKNDHASAKVGLVVGIL